MKTSIKLEFIQMDIIQIFCDEGKWSNLESLHPVNTFISLRGSLKGIQSTSSVPLLLSARQWTNWVSYWLLDWLPLEPIKVHQWAIQVNFGGAFSLWLTFKFDNQLYGRLWSKSKFDSQLYRRQKSLLRYSQFPETTTRNYSQFIWITSVNLSC